MSDCSDMTSYLSRCQSCRVESGCFMVYDRPNYMGNQYFLRRGEYSDYMSFGMSDSIRSCRLIPQIIFYEDRNFQGRSYETSNDCAELTSFLSRCNSCRVESGCFMVYERPNFMGHQMLVRRGEYPDNQRLMGMSQSDCIRSCRMIPMHRGPFRMRIYERENFGGQTHELVDDCDSIMDRYRMSDCQSANVTDGHWLMYEQPQFRGRMIYLRPGEYRSMRDMGMDSSDMRIGSVRRIMDSC
ncbi:gamma-crystallin M3-like isoform 1-T1 [Pholidichthys leucotaenia]